MPIANKREESLQPVCGRSQHEAGVIVLQSMCTCSSEQYIFMCYIGMLLFIKRRVRAAARSLERVSALNN